MNVFTPDAKKHIHVTAVDFKARNELQEPIHIVQGDKTLPIIEVQLYKDGMPYAIPNSFDANIRVGKKDRTFVYNPALGRNSDGTSIYFEVTQQMAAMYGMTPAIVELIDGTESAGSSTFILEIDKNPIQDNMIESNDEYQTIYALRQQTEELKNETKGFRDTASQKATDAATSAASAANSASTAEAAKNAAIAARDTATTAASTATQKANEAATSASATETLKNEAKQKASEAATNAELARNAAITASAVTNIELMDYHTIGIGKPGEGLIVDNMGKFELAKEIQNLHGVSGYSADGEVIELQRTTEQVRTSANLLVMPYKNATEGTVKYESSGSEFIFTGSVASTNGSCFNVATLPAGTYYLTQDDPYVSRVEITHEDGSALSSNAKFTLNQKETIRLYPIVRPYNEKHVCKIMLQSAPADTTGWTPKPYDVYSERTIELTPAPTQSPLNSLAVHGASEQTVTTGANLLYIDLEKLKTWNRGATWNGNQYTYNGIKYTVNDDGTILANGTATENSSLLIFRDFSFTGRMFLSGCPAQPGATAQSYNYRIAYTDNNTGSDTDYGEGVVIAQRMTGTPTFNIYIYQNYTATNLLFKPMLQLYDTPNLINMSAVPTYKTIGGVKVTKDASKGTITIGTGTPTTDIKISFAAWDQESSDQYYVSGCPAGGSTSTYYFTARNGNNGGGYDIGGGTQYRPGLGYINVSPYIMVKAGTVITTPLVFTPRIVRGTVPLPDPEPKPYEPYTYGLHSPSPDYRQDIDIPGWVCKGHQLLDCSDLDAIKALNTAGTWNERKYSAKGVNFEFKKDGSIIINGTPSQDVFLNLNDIPVNNSSKYFLSGCPEGGSNSTYRQYITFGDSSVNDTGDGIVFTATSNVLNYRILVKSGYTATNLLFRPMLQRYEPKNLIDLSTVSNQTINGVTFTVDRQKGTVTANGTATDHAWFRLNTILDFSSDKKYFLYGCPANGDNSKYCMELASADRRDYGGGKIIENLSGNNTPYIIVVNGFTANNLVFTPRLVRGDHAVPDPKPYPFEPFGSGCNLFDMSQAVDNKSVYYVNGYITSSNEYWITGYIPVEVGKTYTRIGMRVAGEAWFYKADKTPLSQIPQTSATFTVPANAAYVVISSLMNGTQPKDKAMLVPVDFSSFPYSPYDPTGGNVAKFNRVETVIIGRNEFNKDAVIPGYITTDGIFQDAQHQYCVSDYISIIGGKAYNLRVLGMNGSGKYSLFWFDEDKNFIGLTNTGNMNGILGVSAPLNAKYARITCLEASKETTCMTMFALEGNEVVLYEPTQSLTLPTPTGLPAIPLPDDAEDYTYIDSRGRKMLADSWVYDGEKVWRVKRVGLRRIKNATFEWNKSAAGLTQFVSSAYRISNTFISNIGKALGDVAQYKTVGVWKYEMSCVVVVPSSIASTVDEFKEYTKNNPIEVYYSLATPTLTEETDPAVISAVMALHTNKDYTFMRTEDYNGMSCWQEVEYYVDKQTPAEKRGLLSSMSGGAITEIVLVDELPADAADHPTTFYLVKG